MKVSKFATVLITNACISFEMLGAFLRLIQDAFAASVASQENIRWDIRILSAQGEKLSLSSFELDDKISQWIRERVITYVRAEISAVCGDVCKEVCFKFEIGAIASIEISGDSAFVDLTDRRITEWKNNLPRSRFPFFILSAFFVGVTSSAFTFAVLATALKYLFVFFEIATPAPIWVALPVAICSLLSGIVPLVYFPEIWPRVSLDLGKPTKEKKLQGIIITAAKWLAGLLALAASAATIFNFLHQ